MTTYKLPLGLCEDFGLKPQGDWGGLELRSDLSGSDDRLLPWALLRSDLSGSDDRLQPSPRAYLVWCQRPGCSDCCACCRSEIPGDDVL